MRRPCIALLIAGLVSAQSPPVAQTAPVQLPAQPSPVIKITTHLVQVSLVAHDKKGQPVSDLKKEDFTLYDKGQEQQIRTFAMETSKPSAATGAAEPKALPAGVVSNRVWSAHGMESSRAASLPNAVTVILLDGLNSRFQDQHAAKTGLLKFLQQIQPNDQVAIYTLGNGLKVLHDFTSDTASLLRAMDRYKAGSSWQLDASTPVDAATGNDDMDDFLNGADDKINTFYTQRRIETTLAALETIAAHLSGMAGRKNLIWLSGSFPLFAGLNADGSAGPDTVGYSDQLQRTLRMLTQVSIAVYPVDSRGLMTSIDQMPSMGAASRAPMRGGRMQLPGQSRGDQRARNNILDTQATMHEVADRTGGRAFMNNNDIGAAIRKAVEDTEVSYVIGYSPTHNEWDGKFREIKVKVNRPGVEIRYRKGYFALPENPSDERARQIAVAAAANSPLASTGLGLLAKVLPPAANADLTAARLNLVVETKDVAFSLNEKNLWAADLDVLMVVRDSNNKALHELSRTVHLGMKQEQYEAFQKTGIGITMTIETPPKSARVRAVVRDAASGALGSLDIPLANTP
jgi:VWFA-related protein